MTLFVYGTLMERSLIESLLKRKLGEPVKAKIYGFMKTTSEWGYPVMIPAPSSTVEGVVWRELTYQDLAILDQYEGCDAVHAVYQREKRKVIVDGREEEAWTYFATSAYLKHLKEENV